MGVKIILPLWPVDERHQLEEGDSVTEKDVKRLLRYHKRAAAMLPRLLADGWEVWFTGCAIWGDHADVETAADVEVRLAILGIPSWWVEMHGVPKGERDGGECGWADPPTGA